MEGASRAELRRFGLTVGGAFVVLGAVSAWRGHAWAPRVLWTLGALLLVPGAVAPAVLGPVQRAWMRGAVVLGRVNGRIILTAFFFLVIWPVGRLRRLFRDPLDRALGDGRASHWVRRPPAPVDPARYERQF
jgi:hypothetical protein